MSPPRTATSFQVARTYYVIAGVYTLSASLIWGINTIFLLRVGGLTLMEVFLANAVFTGSMALFEVPTGIIADARGRRTTLLLGAGFVYSASAVGVGLANSFAIAVTLYLIGMMSAGVFQPVRQAYLHQLVPSAQRATVISLASLVASGGSMLGQSGLGWFAARSSLANGYILGGAISALAIPFVLIMRRLGGPPDVIVGEAGRYASCPTLSLPDGVAVAAERDVQSTTVATV